jgi:hypothetical protein
MPLELSIAELLYHGLVKEFIGKVRRNGIYLVISNSGYLALNHFLIVDNKLESA